MRTALIVLSFLPLFAQAATLEEQVLATDDDYVAAEVRHDEPTLRRLIDDRFQYNSSSGITTDKEALIKNVLGMKMIGQRVSERSVLIEGDVAMVFGTTELHFGEIGKSDSSSVLRYTATYVNRPGGWKMLALQMQKHAQ